MDATLSIDVCEIARLFRGIQEGNFDARKNSGFMALIDDVGLFGSIVDNTFPAPVGTPESMENHSGFLLCAPMPRGRGWPHRPCSYPASGGRGRKDASARNPGLPSAGSTHSSMPRWRRNAPG